MSEDEKKAKRSKKATTNGTVGLFDPMTLRGMTVRNRIWLPPMDTYSALAQDGLPTPFHYQLMCHVPWAVSAWLSWKPPQ